MFALVKWFLLTFFAIVNAAELKRNSRHLKGDSGKSSLAFVFDVTGSMQNDLRQLREGAEMILNTALKESDVIEDFVFVPFRDPEVGPATVTSNKDVFKKALNEVRVYGGGDCPEKSLTGIQLALNISRPRSFLYVFTDATAGDHRTVSKVLDEVQNKQTQVVFIMTGHCNDLDKPSYKVYQQVAAASSGQIFNLKKSSVHKMLEFVKSSIKGRTVNLASATNPAGYNYTQEIPVDSTLGEVTVSVSGAKPKITVVDPKGEQLKGPPKLVTTLDLTEIMVVKVMQPEMGNYLITVGSEEDYSVKVVGLSNLTFNHGFSVQQPNSMEETSYRPLKGAYNNLWISLTQSNVSVDIKYAEIVTLEGKTLFEVPLKEVDRAKKMYVAEPFIPPEGFFYIAINGRDQNNQELRRIGTTAIQAKSPDVPHLTAPEKVLARSHSRVVLTCKVHSLVPFTAKWTKQSNNIQQQITSLHAQSLDIIIEDMKEEHVGTYSCLAWNVAGMSKANTELSIIVEAPQVSIEPVNSSLETGDDVTISCTVYSEALLLENKLVFNGTSAHYAIDLNKEPNLEGVYTYKKTIHVSKNVTGKYTCVATNRGGKTEQSTEISLKRKPTAHILGPHTLSKLINSELQLVCAVDNAHLIVWRAPNNTVIKSTIVTGSSNDVLDVRNVTSDGSWTCTALRGSEKDSDSVTVTVLLKPVVSILGDRNITVLNGTVGQVTCQVVAKPPPRILWHRETEKFLNNTITALDGDVYKSVLSLNSSAESINGTYFCFGENSEGIHQDSVTVNVRRKMTLVRGFTDQIVQLYYQTELRCVTDAYPPGVTHWYHNGTSLVTNDKVKISEDNTILYLMKVDFNDLGEYICEVDNEYEKMEIKGTVSVEGLAGPMVSKEPHRVIADKGWSTIITCRILQGNPEPTISWQYRVNVSIEYSSLPKYTVVNNEGTEITIANVTEDHAGVYRCWAHNAIGQDYYDVTLVVQYPPKLLKDPNEDDNSKSVKLGDSVKLSCEATGVPPPATVWYKDGHILNQTDNLSVTPSDLVIEATSASHAGTYTCNVTSSVGSTQRNFTLEVYDPPSLSLSPFLNRDVLQGQLVELPCDATGLPPPVAVWKQNGQLIKDIYGEQNTLRFIANLTNSGEYTCTIENKHGRTSISYTLNVFDPPKLISSTNDADNRIAVKVGDKVKLSCESTGVPPPVTVWYTNGRPLRYSDQMYLTNSSDLIIESASVLDSGLLICNVTNSVGSVDNRFNLTVYDPPKFVKGTKKENETQAVKLGETVKLSCEASGVPPPETVWYKDGSILDFKDKTYVVNGSELLIEATSVSNAGTYTCNVTSPAGSNHKNFTLDVYDPPLIQPGSSPSKDVLLGQFVDLPCDVQGLPVPVVKWTLNGKSISKDKYSGDNGLRFAAKLNDSGEYICTATNKRGNTSVSYTLYVSDPPKFVMDVKDDRPKSVKLGDSVKLSCEASGVPPPVTVWYKDGRPLRYTDKMYKTNRSELFIEATSASNAGTYTCDVTSSVGSTQRNFSLEIYDPPTIYHPSDPLQEVLEGQLVELPCIAKGLPTPIVEWSQNGEPIGNGKYIEKERIRFVANLTDFGEYTCTATNIYGNTSISYTLHVWVPPYITPQPSVLKEALLGSNVTLQCDVIGFPLPTIEWKFNEELIEENTTDVSFNEIGNLFIRNASFGNEGIYTCVAYNLGGEDELPMYLKVVAPPKIVEDNYTGPYIATDKDKVLSIACHATGKPTPYYMWIKDEFYLNNDIRYSIDVDGTLHIKNPTEDMSGDYTCLANNSAGQHNKTVTVNIYSIPKPTQSGEKLTRVTLLEGSDAELDCPVRASAHTLKWYKNAKVISTGILRLSNVSRDNATTYFCVVSNAVGSTHAKVQVLVEWPPTLIEQDNREIDKVRGDDCYLNCEVDAKPNAKTKWLFNSKALVFENKSYLKLVKVQPRDAGTYKCIVSNLRGTVVKEFVLKVLEPPFISHFDMMDVQLKERDNATLECNAEGTPTPTVTWTYNNSNWHVEGTSLSSVNISTQSEGLYRCDAVNRAGATHLIYRVSVVSAARVVEIVAYVHGEGSTVGQNLEVVQGSYLRVACKATGNPTPYIQWLRQGRGVGENKYDISYADLTLTAVESRQKGLYTCVASNEGGSDDRRINLDVLEPPKIFQSLFDQTNSSETHLEVISGQSYFLHCHPYGNPFPEVYWFKEDVPLRLFDDTMVSTEFGEVIAVKEAREEQSGNYTCVARNKVGNTSVSYLVDVLVPPKPLKESSRKVVANFGKPLVLECPAIGTRPNVMWIKHPYTEINGDKRISLIDDNFTMIISKTIVSDSGNYSCILTNKIGTTELVFEVTVLKRPSIAGNVGTNIVEGHVVPLRRSIVLKCEVDGHPMPQITWLKDTQILNEGLSNIQRVLGNSLLAMWSASARDAGQYICLAENRAGSAHRRYNVAIQVPAKWSVWSSWSLCNVTCGLGHQTRSRLCHYVDDRNNTYDRSSNSETIVLDESACKGPSEDSRKCHMPSCEEDGSKPRWSQWSRWSECSASCGSGSRARTRKCKTKVKCVGDNVQVKKCTDLPPCRPVTDSRHSGDFDPREDVSNSNAYIPEMTFESEPELIDSHYSPDVEEFYSTSGAQSPTAFFDVEVKENLDGSVQGPCDPGYRHNITTNTCDDVDECSVTQNECHLTQVCVNTAGGYRCTCPPGYLALDKGQRCLDINECAMETDGCEYSCVNTAGGYVCACPRHLRLHLDRHHCVIPSMYRRPFGEMEPEYMSTSVDYPVKYTRPRNK